GGTCPGSTKARRVPPSKRIVSPGPCRRCARVAASKGIPTPAKTTWPSFRSRLAITASSSLVVWFPACGLLLVSVVIDAPSAPRGIEQLLHAEKIEILGPGLGTVDVTVEILGHPLLRVFADQRGIHVVMLEEWLVDAIAPVRPTAVGHPDHRLDRQERDLRVVGRPADLVVRDDSFRGQDHLVGGHGEVDVHEL